MMRPVMKAAVLIAWYFLSASTQPNGSIIVGTQGPFPTQERCEHAAKWASAQAAKTKYPVATYPCYSDVTRP